MKFESNNHIRDEQNIFVKKKLKKTLRRLQSYTWLKYTIESFLRKSRATEKTNAATTLFKNEYLCMP